MTVSSILIGGWDGVISKSLWSEKPRDIGQVYLVPENTPNSQVKYRYQTKVLNHPTLNEIQGWTKKHMLIQTV